MGEWGDDISIVNIRVHVCINNAGDDLVFAWVVNVIKDNAHTASLVENFLGSETIKLTRSPDTNPIERVWETLVRRITARPRPPVTKRESNFRKSGTKFP
ncbi:hypothetical protein TNCV_316281 [Trichonephila clavipes]|nr:hypothetical protein TNCV_316281 [Trichonephila clavipes]